jgi:hypothetical protein
MEKTETISDAIVGRLTNNNPFNIALFYKTSKGFHETGNNEFAC